MASLSLLSIPREPRNLIYSYLTQELRPNWTGVFRTTHTDIATSVEVVIISVPILSVLLAHSRLKDEYEQCSASRNVTMTLRLKSRRDSNKQSLSVLSKRLKTYPTSSIKHILAHIVRVVIFVDCGKRPLIMFHSMVYQTSSNVWPTRQVLAAPLAVLSPKLSSLKVAISFKPEDAVLYADEEYPSFTTGRFLPFPLNRFDSLPLEQHAEAYRLSHGNSADHANDTTQHVITKVGCYPYTKGSATTRYWRSQEVLEEWPNTDKR